METTNFFKTFVQQFSENLPPSLRNCRREFEQQFLEGLKLLFTKLSLVTQEEFEIQEQILNRTRDKVEQLQQRIARIEQQNDGTI